MSDQMPQDAVQERFFTAAGGQPPTEEQLFAVEYVVGYVNGLALAIMDVVPDNRNREIALTALEDVQMRANRAIFAKGVSA